MRKASMRLMAPRIHILGPGGIGSLFAYNFHQQHIPFTFFQRKAPPPATPDSPNSNSKGALSLKYMNLSATETTSVEPRSIDGIDWEPLYPIIDKELFRNDPIYNELSRQPIHQLLVTTKTYQTVDALSKIRHRLRPWTTIVLMQNGMGVREEICESMGWTDRERPNFVQGTISHGAQKSGNTIVHTGRGNVWIAPVLDTPAMIQLRSAAAGSISDGYNTIPRLESILHSPSEVGQYPSLVKPSKDVLSTRYPFKSPAPFIAPYTNAKFSSFYEPLASDEELCALRTRSMNETLMNFKRLSTGLDLELLMPDHLLALQLSKVVVNACVNPVATLLEYSNGELLASPEANEVMKSLLKESFEILSRSEEYKGLPEKFQREFLSLEALTRTTFGILERTKPNKCSTLQDYLKGSKECELGYMNGYFVKMAERIGDSEVQGSLHRMVMEKALEKFAKSR